MGETSLDQGIQTGSQGSAASGANEAFGGFSASLRGMLDAMFAADEAMNEFFRFLRGTFLGDWS